MNRLLFALVVAGTFGSGAAMAQTCTAPGAWMAQPNGAPVVTSDLCAGSDSVALYCDFLDSAGKNDAIWQINLAAGLSATQISISGTAAGFNPVTYLYSSACAAGSSCTASGDAGNPLLLGGVAPGAYFLAASAASSDATGACGAVALATDGFLPVALQGFAID